MKIKYIFLIVVLCASVVIGYVLVRPYFFPALPDLPQPTGVYAVGMSRYEWQTDNSSNKVQQVPQVFTTERMIAHRITEKDFNDLYALLSNPEVGKTLGGTHSVEKTQKHLRYLIDHWNQHGFGFWLFYDKQAGAFIGRGGLRYDSVEGINEVALSYAIMPEYWSKGFATEIAQACIKIGFENLGLNSIVSFTDATNLASRRVMEKNGFTYEKVFNYAHLQPVLYRLHNPSQIAFAVDIFYPTSMTKSTQRSAYQPQKMAVLQEYFAKTSYIPRIILKKLLYGVHTYTQLNAPVLQAEAPYPVLIYLPGIGSEDWHNLYTQELASHGYVVVAIEPPHDVLVSVRADGSVVELDQTLTQAIKKNDRNMIYQHRNQAHERWTQYILSAIDQFNACSIPMQTHRFINDLISTKLACLAIRMVAR